MKHIFMGKILHIRYHLLGYYKNSPICYIFDDKLKSNNYVIRNEKNMNYYSHVFIDKCIKNIEWKEIYSTELIQERLDIGNYVLVKGKKLKIEKIIQKDNGDVIVYLDKVIEKIEDKESRKEAERLLNVYTEKRNKKWWKFGG